MKILIGSLICVSGILCATPTWAQEKAADRTADAARPAVTAEKEGAEKEVSEGRQRMGEIERSLFAVRQRLGLGGRDRSSIKDQEVAQLYDTAEVARRALDDKGRELVKADAEGGQLLTQIEDLQKKVIEMQQQQRTLEKQLTVVAQRVGLHPSRGERGAAPAPAVDPALIALRKTADAARMNLEEKMEERVKADPEGAKLMQERDELISKFQGKRERRQDRKPEDQR